MKKMITLNHLALALMISISYTLFMVSSAVAKDTKIDSSTTIDQLETLALKGNADAMLELGERLIQGQGADTNATQGLQWIRKAADAGKANAWFDLGMIYSNGMGVALDMPKAIDCYHKGAEMGNAECQGSLGLLYQAGERVPGGVKENLTEAAKWYRLAAEQNQTEAMFHLAQLYLWGQGVKQDDAEAVKWFRKGSELGSADAQWNLGKCYQVGKAVTKDNVQAYALWVAAVAGAENPDQKKGMSEQLDKLGKEMTPEQIVQGKKLSKEWIAKGIQ
jgi:TPR repeat protein